MNYNYFLYFADIPSCSKCRSRGHRFRCISCLREILDQKNPERKSPSDNVKTQNTTKNITINIKKSRKDLKDKCRKMTKKKNENTVTKKKNVKSDPSYINENNAIKSEKQGKLPEITIEPIDFLNKIANEIDDNTRIADSAQILNSSYFYSQPDIYSLDSTFI